MHESRPQNSNANNGTGHVHTVFGEEGMTIRQLLLLENEIATEIQQLSWKLC